MMLTRVVFRDPELPHTLRDPQPRLRGWQWLAIGFVFGLAVGAIVNRPTAEEQRLRRLMGEAQSLRLQRQLNEVQRHERRRKTMPSDQRSIADY